MRMRKEIFAAVFDHVMDLACSIYWHYLRITLHHCHCPPLVPLHHSHYTIGVVLHQKPPHLNQQHPVAMSPRLSAPIQHCISHAPTRPLLSHHSTTPPSPHDTPIIPGGAIQLAVIVNAVST